MQTLSTPLDAVQWLRGQGCTALASDSRAVTAGDAFIAWPGAAADARRFVADALAQGAHACLVENDGAEAFDLPSGAVGSYAGLKADTGAIASAFYGEPSQALAMVAITGTNGKTSTSWWLAQALSALPSSQALPCGVIGTLGVGRPPVVESTGLTTPDPVLLQKTLRQFVNDGLRACAIEASSIGIEEHRLQGMAVRVAVLTNFTQDHLDYHGSMPAYWQAKRKLFAWPGLAHAVLNIDDPQGMVLADELAAGPLDVWTTSVLQPARLQARNVRHNAQGMVFDVVEGTAVHTLQSQAVGLYNVSNLLGVIATMRCLGIALDAAVQACAALQPVPGRMECLGGDQTPLVAVDYAHTPDALAQALLALRPIAQERGGQLWCVFGCGGDRDATKRPLMGAIAVQQADHVVVTSDNPRSEKPEAILSQILLGMVEAKGVDVEVDRAQAIRQAVLGAQSQDVILVAGKGHEATQEIAGTKHVFADRAHVAHTDGFTGFVAVAVIARVDAHDGLLDFLQQFALAVAGAQLQRVLFFNGRAVCGVRHYGGVFAQVLGGFTGAVQDVALEDGELEAERGQLHFVHVFGVGHGQQLGISQLSDGLGLPVVGKLGVLLGNGRDNGSNHWGGHGKGVGGFGGCGGHRLRHGWHGELSQPGRRAP
jgi:UDP-N-acetylmuramoyl-L-alanyl-D-glutamate--2,6-diaminopimelate ligase